MKRTYYDAVITRKEPVNGIFRHSYRAYKKIRYKMNGDNLKVWIYSQNGGVEISEFTNVADIRVTKYKK